MIYLFDTEFLDLEDKKLYNKLPADRIEKVNRLAKENDKKLSLGAGLLLNFAIKDYCVKKGIPCPEFPLNIKTNKHEKPTISNNDIQFNLSHSGQYAICVVDEILVGIDIQILRDNKTDISKKVLTERESKLFGTNIENAVKVFCIKEAILKKQGVGLSMGLKNIELATENPEGIFESKAKLIPLEENIYSVEGLNETVFTVNEVENIIVNTAVLEDKDGTYLISQC